MLKSQQVIPAIIAEAKIRISNTSHACIQSDEILTYQISLEQYNVAITVDLSNDNTYIMLEDRLEALFKDPAEYKILERFDWLKELLTIISDDVTLQVQGEFPTT